METKLPIADGAFKKKKKNCGQSIIKKSRQPTLAYLHRD